MKKKHSALPEERAGKNITKKMTYHLEYVE